MSDETTTEPAAPATPVADPVGHAAAEPPAPEAHAPEAVPHHDEPAAAVADHAHAPVAEVDQDVAEVAPAEGAAAPAEVWAPAQPVAEGPAEAPEEAAAPTGEDETPAAPQVEAVAEPEPVAALEEAVAAEPEVVADAVVEPAAEAAPPAPESNKKWYVVKVQSNREESIKAAVERQVKIQGLEEFFGQIVIPVEEYYEKKKVSVKDKKTGQKVTEERNVAKNRKKYPGYLFAEVEFNDRILYVFRETSGVGDFVGATHHRAPSPMPDREVQQMLTGVAGPDAPKGRKVKVKLDFEKGDKVRIREGAFAGSEAEVKAISEPKDPTDAPKVTVVVTIWGRPVEMEMDSFQVDKA